ncbi:MAG: hypothetical protein ACR2QC_05215 [Gammaproteobacteria bacterium]
MTAVAEAIIYNGGGLLPSALPWYAVNADNPADAIYTKREVAADCYQTFKRVADDNGYDLRRHLFLEPSAGEGCFLQLLPPSRRIALDIAPRHSEIRKADFLEWSPPCKGKYAVIGNPPFGIRGAIALAFLNRAALFADIAGFILPMTFASRGKGAAQTRVRGMHLLHGEEMPANAFYDGKSGIEADINTVFQVWGARRPAHPAPASASCENFAELYSVSTYHSRRCGLSRMGEYDFFIQGTFYGNRPPRVVADFADVKYGSGYGIIIKRQKRAVAAALKNADWTKHSTRSTNHCRHIRMQHIRDVLVAAGFVDGVVL